MRRYTPALFALLLLIGAATRDGSAQTPLSAGLDSMIRARSARLEEGETYAQALRQRFDSLQRTLAPDVRDRELSAVALRIVRVEIKVAADRLKLLEYRALQGEIRRNATVLRRDTLSPAAAAQIADARSAALADVAAVFARWEPWIVTKRHRATLLRLRTDLGKEL